MKIYITLMLAVLVSASAFAQARPGAYPWTATLKIVDEAGTAMEGVKIAVGYHSATNSINGLTDTNGMFTASHTDRTYELDFSVKKTGYYPDYISYELYKPGQFNDQKVAANRNASLTFIIRKIGNPMPLYAKQERLKFQQEGKLMGFDLMVGDWVTPNGRGFHADVYFTLNRQIINDREYHCDLSLTFPNKGDGITVSSAEAITGSEFKTSRMAATDGYQPELDMHYSHTNSPEAVFGYFLRVRTELDAYGKVKSALYGKISGNFKFYAGTIVPRAGMAFIYYLNPTPNDQNVEFDPLKNLVRDLKPDEAVSEP